MMNLTKNFKKVVSAFVCVIVVGVVATVLGLGMANTNSHATNNSNKAQAQTTKMISKKSNKNQMKKMDKAM